MTYKFTTNGRRFVTLEAAKAYAAQYHQETGVFVAIEELDMSRALTMRGAMTLAADIEAGVADIQVPAKLASTALHLLLISEKLFEGEILTENASYGSNRNPDRLEFAKQNLALVKQTIEALRTTILEQVCK